jgi:hypothetical protein
MKFLIPLLSILILAQLGEMDQMPTIMPCTFAPPRYSKAEVDAIKAYEACTKKANPAVSFLPPGQFPLCEEPKGVGAEVSQKRQQIQRAFFCAQRIVMNIPKDNFVTQCQDDAKRPAFAALLEACKQKELATIALNRKNREHGEAVLKECVKKHSLGHKLLRVEPCRR